MLLDEIRNLKTNYSILHILYESSSTQGESDIGSLKMLFENVVISSLKFISNGCGIYLESIIRDKVTTAVSERRLWALDSLWLDNLFNDERVFGLVKRLACEKTYSIEVCGIVSAAKCVLDVYYKRYSIADRRLVRLACRMEKRELERIMNVVSAEVVVLAL